MPTYPRTTVAAILAGLAGGIATAVITALTVTTLTVTTLNATTSHLTNATSTNLSVETQLDSALTSSTRSIIGQGTAIDFHKFATSTIDPASMPTLGSTTSSVLTVSGVAAGDSIFVTRPTQWAGQPALIHAWASGSNAVTVNFVNVTSSALDLASGVISLDIWSH